MIIVGLARMQTSLDRPGPSFVAAARRQRDVDDRRVEDGRGLERFEDELRRRPAGDRDLQRVARSTTAAGKRALALLERGVGDYGAKTEGSAGSAGGGASERL